MTRSLALHLTAAWLTSGIIAAILAFVTHTGFRGSFFFGLVFGPVAGLIAFHRWERS